MVVRAPSGTRAGRDAVGGGILEWPGGCRHALPDVADVALGLVRAQVIENEEPANRDPGVNAPCPRWGEAASVGPGLVDNGTACGD